MTPDLAEQFRLSRKVAEPTRQRLERQIVRLERAVATGWPEQRMRAERFLRVYRGYLADLTRCPGAWEVYATEAGVNGKYGTAAVDDVCRHAERPAAVFDGIPLTEAQRGDFNDHTRRAA